MAYNSAGIPWRKNSVAELSRLDSIAKKSDYSVTGRGFVFSHLKYVGVNFHNIKQNSFF